MSATVIGKLKNTAGEVKMIEISPKIPVNAEKGEDKQEQVHSEEQRQIREREQSEASKQAQSQDNAVIPPIVKNISKKETKFFSEPKKVKKKTEGSIIGFQLITSFIFCLLLLLSRLGAPQLYDNLQLFLSRVFR